MTAAGGVLMAAATWASAAEGTLPMEALRRGPGKGQAIVFVPPHGGTALLFESADGGAATGREAGHGEVVQVLSHEDCRTHRTRIRAGTYEGFVRSSFLLRHYTLSQVPETGWSLLRQVTGGGAVGCPETGGGERARFYSVLEDGSIADAAPDCGYAIVYDDRQGLFRSTLHEGTSAGGTASGLAIFRATDGTIDPVTAPRAVAPSLDPLRGELYYRVDGTGQAVRVAGTPDGLVEEELPGTTCTGPAAAAAVKVLDGGRRLVVPGVRGFLARKDETRFVVMLGDEASYAPAHARMDAYARLLRDPPRVLPSALFPPLPAGRFLVVARIALRLQEAERLRADLAGVKIPAVVRSFRVSRYVRAYDQRRSS